MLVWPASILARYKRSETYIHLTSLTITVLFLCLMTLGPGTGCKDEPAGGSPRLVCYEQNYDFGKRNRTDTVKHSFVVKNEGNAPLIIRRVKPFCRCTVGKLSKNVLQPDEEVTIHVQLVLYGLSGVVHKKILIESNDPHNPKGTLHITGTVTDDILITPFQVSFLGIHDDTKTDKVVRIDVLNPDINLNIERVESESQYFVPETKTLEKGKSYELTIHTKPPLPEGLTTGSIRIFTDNDEYGTLEIPVKADVFGELIIFPEEIILTIENNHNTKSSPYVAVIPGKTRIFELKNVISPSTSIKTKIVPLGQSGYKIELTIPVVTKDLEGQKLRITTNVENMKEILVPFRIVDKFKHR